MNETPRLRSAFPASPQGGTRRRVFNNNSSSTSFSNASPRPSNVEPTHESPSGPPVRVLAALQQQNKHPFIPFDVIDAPTQRRYIVSIYVLSIAWRIYNCITIDDSEPAWQFLKWAGFDAALLLLLPGFCIPWLEFSVASSFTVWLAHAVLNLCLMFRIPVWAPLLTWLGGFIKPFFDSELSISSQRVKPASILHNDSIILGKQIIHILPEGSAILNPSQEAFCLDAHTASIDLLIQINQTTPIRMELTRVPLDGEEEEQLVLDSKLLKALKKTADKGYQKSDVNTPRTLKYPVQRTGLYRLDRVIDKSNLDVRRRSYDVAVVKCPEASVSIPARDRCTGDLSGVSIVVAGVAPFKVKYNKRINQQQFSSITQSIQGSEPDISIVHVDPVRPQIAQTQFSSVSFEINEALQRNGSWSYTVEEVEDGLGNKVVYDVSNDRTLARDHRTDSLTVHNRPTANLVGCGSEHRLRVAAGGSVSLPVRIHPPAQLPAADWPLKLKYTFTPDSDDAVSSAVEETFDMANEWSIPRISKAGSYNLESVDTQFCTGKVIEPSSCTLVNPPRPSLTIDSEEVFDKCAGNPIGMNVILNFAGTPPFKVRYTVTTKGVLTPKVAKFNDMRGLIEFKEDNAGSYTYQFLELEDDVYEPVSLKNDNLVLKQNIKPPTTAMFVEGRMSQNACLGQPIDLPVRLIGQGPWNLEYQILHYGKRKKETVHVETDIHVIRVPSQTEGGEYSVILTSVQDQVGCRTSLKDERKVIVRPEQPRASFAEIDGKRSASVLEGKDLKLSIRLKGIAPWSVEVQNLDDGTSASYRFENANAVVPVNRPGTYEITSVKDSCPGMVDPKANTFKVSWIARPQLSVKSSDITLESGHTYRKAPVCQGDESSFALGFTGQAPFHIKFTQRVEPVRGSAAISNKPLSFASNHGLIQLNTAKAGETTYTLSELSDGLYAFSKERDSPIVVKQQVYAPPTAVFANPGKTYGYCKDEADIGSSPPESELIPLSLTGSPPFVVEFAINHHSLSSRPEIIRIKDIPSTTYSYALSRSSLDLGIHTISVRSVKDSRGCENLIESDPSSVRVSVSSPPQIIPLESKTDYCVGEHVSFSLSGQAPFEILYTFQDRERKAKVSGNEFKRIAESPGEFVITGISDSVMGGGGKCKARKDITKSIHAYPSVEIGHGDTVISDIHAGGEVDMVFHFTGTPPFEFTYTRSETVARGVGRVLETRSERSDEFTKVVRASDEGTYEVVAIKDRYCAYAKPGWAAGGQKRLT
ncbi:hypothetical protein DV738_g1819, partial [Chaetothyriales sp. CBS 135597]